MREFKDLEGLDGGGGMGVLRWESGGVVGDGGRGWWWEGGFPVETVLEHPFVEEGGVVGFAQAVDEGADGGVGGGAVDFGDEVETVGKRGISVGKDWKVGTDGMEWGGIAYPVTGILNVSF